MEVFLQFKGLLVVVIQGAKKIIFVYLCSNMKAKAELLKMFFLLRHVRESAFSDMQKCVFSFIDSSVGDSTILCRFFPVFSGFLPLGYFSDTYYVCFLIHFKQFLPVIAIMGWIKGYYFPDCPLSSPCWNHSSTNLIFSS